jgi:hypothetical protein
LVDGIELGSQLIGFGEQGMVEVDRHFGRRRERSR